MSKPLSSRDMTALQRATLALYSHRDIASFRRRVPEIFLGIIRADHFSLADVRIDVEKRTLRMLSLWESRPLIVGAVLEAMERNLFDHPFTRHGIEHGIDGALRISDRPLTN